MLFATATVSPCDLGQVVSTLRVSDFPFLGLKMEFPVIKSLQSLLKKKKKKALLLCVIGLLFGLANLPGDASCADIYRQKPSQHQPQLHSSSHVADSFP